jgi:spermidine synthase
MAEAYFLSISAIAGATALALEFLAARAMAPVFGSGPVSWAAMLAVALGMLAVGNLLGGHWSNRAKPLTVVTWALIVASIPLTILAQWYGPALRWSAEQPMLVGELIAVLAIQAVPMTMLGMISPVILHHRRDGGGRWAGCVLAAGSGGGIVGALATALLLVPGCGLACSFILLAAVLAVAALPAVWHQRRWLAGLVLLASFAMMAWSWVGPEESHVVESLFGQLEVRKNAVAKVLIIDGMQQTGLPTGLEPGDALRHGYLLELALPPGHTRKTALVIGLGGGLAPRLLAQHGIDCDAIEIDPAVVEIARRDFDFAGNVTVGDGRVILSRTKKCYDLILLDACTADRLAWHLFTLEAMRLVRERLSPGGTLAIQFIGDDGPWAASLMRTVDAVFGRRSSVMLAPTNVRDSVGVRWLFVNRDGSAQTHEMVGFFRASPHPGPLPEGEGTVVRDLTTRWRRIEMATDGAVLTDDHFPTELAWAETARQWRSRCSVLP